MPKSRDEYTAANREAWNEAAPRHAEHNNARLLEAFKNPGHIVFQGEILETLSRVGVRGKQVIQLACNNGCETLSLRNMGAARAVGVDASEEFLAHGRQLVEAAGATGEVELVQADIYRLPEELEDSFDVVVSTIGVIGWMPDIEAFFEVVHDLLKPGGRLVMEEMHPVLLMYEPNPVTGVSTIEYSYFSGQTWEETNGLDYYGGEQYESKPSYSFMHRLDEILMAGLNNGLNLTYFKELDHDISLFCSDLEHSRTKPPLGFDMVMEKPAA